MVRASAASRRTNDRRSGMRQVKSAEFDPRLAERARQIVGREIDFIYNPVFDEPAAEAEILAEPPESASTGIAKRPAGLPAYLASLYEVALLTGEQEVALFRKMNFLKFRANRVRSRLDPDRPDAALIAEYDRLLAEEKRVRNRIARCNLRLVVSIARKFGDRDNPFDEFVSDGNLALLHAIAKFDYGRGFRFSTYATHAIQRSFYRQVRQKQRRTNRVTLGSSELLNETEDRPSIRPADETQYRQFQSLIDQMSDRLDEREQAILTARFGLDGADKGLTLQKVAKKLGICKERVRQLQNRAIEKLRDLAAELNVEAPALSL